MFDTFGSLFVDPDFAALFSDNGQPALSPARLMVILILQFMEGLSDRQAADAARSRIDWEDLLRLESMDPGRPGAARRHTGDRPGGWAGARFDAGRDPRADWGRVAGIEGTISLQTRIFDLRRTRYLSMAKIHLQYILTACAIKLTRLAR